MLEQLLLSTGCLDNQFFNSSHFSKMSQLGHSTIRVIVLFVNL